MTKRNRQPGRWAVIIGAIVVIALLWWIWRALPRLRLDHEEERTMLPTQIESIRDIGQWEFLEVSNEELVDTTRRGFFSDDHLVRIYYGTLRLGLDLSQFSEDAVTFNGDTLVLSLPPISLLDDRFIDEARTRAFHEEGSWSASDLERMYQKARRQMLRHSLTAQNKAIAQSNAEAQLRQLLRAMGYKKVVIGFKGSEADAPIPLLPPR